MSSSRVATSCGGSILGAAIGALSGAVSGSAGAAMLSAAGHAQHFAPMSAKIGAAGGALLFGVSGCCSSFFNVNNASVKPRECVAVIASYTVGQIVSGMIGYGLMYKAGASEIPFGAVVADMAVVHRLLPFHLPLVYYAASVSQPCVVVLLARQLR